MPEKRVKLTPCYLFTEKNWDAFRQKTLPTGNGRYLSIHLNPRHYDLSTGNTVEGTKGSQVYIITSSRDLNHVHYYINKKPLLSLLKEELDYKNFSGIFFIDTPKEAENEIVHKSSGSLEEFCDIIFKAFNLPSIKNLGTKEETSPTH